MPGEACTGHIRLAELVAALSLGIDLGFGQPMEHVLRQCLIALRLAERIGLDEPSRAVVYYTALLISVGCHSDAHEQAKWFGDDITMKSDKFVHGFGLRGAAAGMARLGAGNPPLHRFRVGLEFLVSGHRDLGGMIERHARLAQSFAEQLGLPRAVIEALGSGYEQWNGRGWPRKLAGEEVPVASRLAHIAEYVEVAHRVGGSDAAVALARKQRGKQFDPALADLLCDRAAEIFSGLDSVTTWNAVIEAEPALAVVLSDEQFDASRSRTSSTSNRLIPSAIRGVSPSSARPLDPCSDFRHPMCRR
jgi:HD domain